MGRTDLTLVRPEAAAHRQAVIDLTAKAFAEGDYWNCVTGCRDSYMGDSHHDWRASTIGLLDGKVVTHWGVWGYRMRIGRARLGVAGIGAVATHGEFRKQGLMARTARAGAQAARAAGYDMSVLFGIGDFYHRFGYVRAWAGQTYHAAADTLPAPPTGMRLRAFAPRHRDDLARLYNRLNARLAGTAVRPTFRAPRRGRNGYLWHDASGQPAGYVVVSERKSTHFDLIDHAGDPPAVLGALGRLAQRRRATEVRFRALHYDSALARTLRRGDCRLETSYHRSGEAMIRTLNLTATLKKMCGELSARMKRSHLADWRGDLLIADSREKALLRIDRSRVTVAAPGPTKHTVRGGDRVAQLLIGTDDPCQTADAARMRLAGDARRLLDVLLPCRHPMLAAWDHF